MPVNLNTIPGPALRPLPPKPLRWLSTLVGLIATGILLMRFLGKLVGETSFWWFAIGIPVLFWVVLMGFRLTVYIMQQIHANAWDKRREQVILQEVRRGRRALQILAAEHRTALVGRLNSRIQLTHYCVMKTSSFLRLHGMARAASGTVGYLIPWMYYRKHRFPAPLPSYCKP